MNCNIPGFTVLHYQPLLILMPIESVMLSNHLMLCLFPQVVVIHTVKGFGIVNKAEVDVFMELSCLSIIQWMLSFGFSAFSKSSLNILKVTVHILLKPCLENFEHYFTSSEMSAIVQ